MARTETSVSARFGAAGQENDHALLYLLFATGSVIVANDLDITSLASLRKRMSPGMPVMFGCSIRTTMGASCFLTKTDPVEVIQHYNLSLDNARRNKTAVLTALAEKNSELKVCAVSFFVCGYVLFYVLLIIIFFKNKKHKKGGSKTYIEALTKSIKDLGSRVTELTHTVFFYFIFLCLCMRKQNSIKF
jgi:hypothetical protein